MSSGNQPVRHSEAIIDTHLHVWDPQRASYPWLGPELGPLQRAVRFGEIKSRLSAFGIEGVILVQAADNLEDTQQMLDLADTETMVLGVVGYLPLHTPREVHHLLRRENYGPRLSGVRTLVHDRADPRWILEARQTDSLTAISDFGLPYDMIVTRVEHQQVLLELAANHPNLHIVLDHLGKPPFQTSHMEAWAAWLRQVGEFPNVTAKLSGLYGHVRPQAWNQEDVDLAVATALDAFGPTRLMFGSDWPIAILAGDYERISAAVLSSIRGQLSDSSAQSAILSENARAVYRLTR